MKYLPWRSSRFSPAHSRKGAAYTLLQSPFQLAEHCHLPQLMGVRRRTRLGEWHILLINPAALRSLATQQVSHRGRDPGWDPASQGRVSCRTPLPTVPHQWLPLGIRVGRRHWRAKGQHGTAVTGQACPAAALCSPLPSFRGQGPCAVQLRPLRPCTGGRGLTKLLLRGEGLLFPRRQFSWCLVLPGWGDGTLGFFSLDTAHHIPEKVYKYMKIQ